jgi:hypothetical protein
MAGGYGGAHTFEASFRNLGRWEGGEGTPLAISQADEEGGTRGERQELAHTGLHDCTKPNDYGTEQLGQ